MQPTDALTQAWQLHQAGDLSRAEQIYRRLLQHEPSNIDALNLLGAACLSLSKLDEAIGCLREAVRLQPDNAAAFDNLGIAYARQGHLENAITCYCQALRLQPGQAETHVNLGTTFLKQGNLEDASGSFRKALQLSPENAAAHFQLGNCLARQGMHSEAIVAYRDALRLRPGHAAACFQLGNALMAQGQCAEAEAIYRQALRHRPDSAETYVNLGNALSAQKNWAEASRAFHEALHLKPSFVEAWINLGAAQMELGKTDEAIGSYQQALQRKPDSPEALNNLGNALLEIGQFDEALASLRQAIDLKPDSADMRNNLGSALSRQGLYNEAIAVYQEALTLQPDSVEALSNLGHVFIRQGKLDEAAATFDEAVRLKPDYPEAHGHRAAVWLIQGDWERGLAEYEWRWQCKEFHPRTFAHPAWDGSALHGRTILVHAEQGLGDTIQFIRYAPLVKERGGRVLVECPQALLPLFAGFAGSDQLLPRGTPLPPFDVQVSLMSLPRLFGTTPATIPAPIPYLFAEPARVEHWRRELRTYDGFKIGFVWQGNPRYRHDRQRSLPLSQFIRLARVPGAHLFTLQKGAGTEQLKELPPGLPITELGSRLDESCAPFFDTAAVMKNLDVVISPDTAAAHLAGALGVPVWLALTHMPEWRWLLEREDTPWYPTMRLFRQTELGDWDGVFARMETALRQHIAANRSAPAIRVEVAPGELIDKITILEIKTQRITDTVKLDNVRRELSVLSNARAASLPSSAELDRLTAELRGINEALWEIEDEIRECERRQDFGPRFIELARSVYRHNDRRAAAKRAINELLGARFMEEKTYKPY